MFKDRMFSVAAGVLAVSCLVGASPTLAQSSGTSAHSGSGSSTGPAAGTVARDPMPRIDVSVFPVGGTDPNAVPTGTAGVIAPPGVAPDAYGTAPEKWPYTTARVAVTVLGSSTNVERTPVTSFPFRAAGKLWMRFGTSWFVCTASLIKKGVLITAAHCVHHYGQGNAGFADEVWWAPANTQFSQPPTVTAGQPYGWYRGQQWRIMNVYKNGTDTCQAGAIGVVCNNDLATVTLAPKGRDPVFAGQVVGWYTYGWNGYSTIASPAFGNATVSQVTQLGYPQAIDGGAQMIRNDSFGKYIQGTGANGKVLKNTQLGSSETGGSSGGPWLVNFGTAPSFGAGSSAGNAPVRNAVNNVTSWGYTSVGVNVQGASWFGQNAEFGAADYGGFGAGNIGKLVQDTCVANPTYC